MQTIHDGSLNIPRIHLRKNIFHKNKIVFPKAFLSVYGGIHGLPISPERKEKTFF